MRNLIKPSHGDVVTLVPIFPIHTNENKMQQLKYKYESTVLQMATVVTKTKTRKSKIHS